jgi:hypothetical protein
MKFLIIGSVIAFAFGIRKNKLRDNDNSVDCTKGGTFKELCYDKNKAMPLTNSMYLPEFDCYDKTDCKEFNGICQWEQDDDDFQKCLSEKRVLNPNPIAAPNIGTSDANAALVTPIAGAPLVTAAPINIAATPVTPISIPSGVTI